MPYLFDLALCIACPPAAVLVIPTFALLAVLQFLGRENLEDYNAIFLVMFEEAAVKFRHAGNFPQVTDMARLLSLGGGDGIRARPQFFARH